MSLTYVRRHKYIVETVGHMMSERSHRYTHQTIVNGLAQVDRCLALLLALEPACNAAAAAGYAPKDEARRPGANWGSGAGSR